MAVGKWCLGHGVVGKGESLRTGHYVEAHFTDEMFSTRDGDARASKGLARTLEPRCRICRSIRRWHDHHENAVRRANRFRGEHARRWVKLGRHTTEAAALREMDTGGVTVEALTALILAAVGEPCPGLCTDEVDGVIVRCTIDSVTQIHIDVRDPSQPFSIENIGVLCLACNPAKGDMPWAAFIYMRRMGLRVWQAAIDRPDYRRPEQLGIDSMGPMA